MYSNKSFQMAVIVSVLAHSILFLGLPRTSFLPVKRSLEKLTITYYKVKKEPKRKEMVRKKTEPVARPLPEIKREEILTPPKSIAKKAKKIRRKTKHVAAVKGVKEKKFEKVIEEETDAAKRATYISYYRAVRERIRRYADKNYPRNRNLGEGEIFLSFVVASSGELIGARVVNEKSIDNDLLRNIAVNSVRDANPFPSFPKGMSQYRITFNVVISFELK